MSSKGLFSVLAYMSPKGFFSVPKGNCLRAISVTGLKVTNLGCVAYFLYQTVPGFVKLIQSERAANRALDECNGVKRSEYQSK